MRTNRQSTALHGVLKHSKWCITIILFWLIYLFLTILTYPAGSLTDSADAAIVLGAAVYDTKPSPVFAERINHAINLYHSGRVKKLIFTGGTDEENSIAESEIARSYAIGKQVDSDDILIESLSSTTYENLLYAKQILEQKKLETVLIVSDSLHLKRALLMANSLTMFAKASGTPTSRYQGFNKRIPFALRELYFYHYHLLFSK